MPQGRDESLFIDHTAPGNVDENGVGLHERKFPGTDQMVGFGSQRYGDAKKVCFPQQFIQMAKAGLQGFGFRLGASIPIGDLHVKAEMSAAGDGLADASISDNAQALSMNVRAKKRAVDVLLPSSLFDILRQFDHPPGRRHDQGKCHVSGGFGQDIGGVGQQNAPAVKVFQIVVIVPNGDAGNDFQTPCCVQKFRFQFDAGPDKPVSILNGFGKSGLFQFRLENNGDLEFILQRIDEGLRQFTPEGDDLFSHVGFPF